MLVLWFKCVMVAVGVSEVLLRDMDSVWVCCFSGQTIGVWNDIVVASSKPAGAKLAVATDRGERGGINMGSNLYCGVTLSSNDVCLGS